MLASASRRRRRVAVDIPPATPPTITTRIGNPDSLGSAITVTIHHSSLGGPGGWRVGRRHSPQQSLAGPLSETRDRHVNLAGPKVTRARWPSGKSSGSPRVSTILDRQTFEVQNRRCNHPSAGGRMLPQPWPHLVSEGQLPLLRTAPVYAGQHVLGDPDGSHHNLRITELQHRTQHRVVLHLDAHRPADLRSHHERAKVPA